MADTCRAYLTGCTDVCVGVGSGERILKVHLNHVGVSDNDDEGEGERTCGHEYVVTCGRPPVLLVSSRGKADALRELRRLADKPGMDSPLLEQAAHELARLGEVN